MPKEIPRSRLALFGWPFQRRCDISDVTRLKAALHFPKSL
jgi:hypothetical protein